MAETYTLKVAGLTRELTICKVNDHMDIAAFIMLGDTELTVAAAAELLKKCPEFDILLTAEAKGIPLAHEMSRQSGKPYVCARKNVKLYMKDPVVVEDQSITTEGKQKLVIDRKELDEMNGKRVLVVDDVISTAAPSRRWTPWPSRPIATSWGRPPSWPRATQPSARTSSSWSRCPCSSTDGVRRPVCVLFAGALGTQLIAAFEPQAGFWPLAALFGLGLLVLLAGGRARGWGLWLLLGAALGLAFSARTGAQFDALTAAYGGRTVRLTATVEDVQEGYTRSTVRARLRVSEVNGEPAAFCCQCDGLPLSRAGEQVEGWFSLEAPAPADRPGRYADEVAFLAGVRAPVPPAGPGARLPRLVGPAAEPPQRGAVPGAGRRRSRCPGGHDRRGPHPHQQRTEQRLPGGGAVPRAGGQRDARDHPVRGGPAGHGPAKMAGTGPAAGGPPPRPDGPETPPAAGGPAGPDGAGPAQAGPGRLSPGGWCGASGSLRCGRWCWRRC